jgi:hypothetical protein
VTWSISARWPAWACGDDDHVARDVSLTDGLKQAASVEQRAVAVLAPLGTASWGRLSGAAAAHRSRPSP